MSETTVTTSKPSFCWSSLITGISLTFNGLTLLLLLVLIFCHHRHHFQSGSGGEQGFHGPMDRGDHFPEHRMMGEKDGGSHEGPWMQEHRQGPMDPAQMSDRLLEHLSTRLSLTDQQKTQIRPLIEQQAAAFKKDAEDRRKAMEQAITDFNAKLKLLLTPDQQKILSDMPGPLRH